MVIIYLMTLVTLSLDAPALGRALHVIHMVREFGGSQRLGVCIDVVVLCE